MILGIDQGTTGSTAILLTDDGRPLASFTAPVPQHYPQPGRVEHDPKEVWKSVELAIQGVLKKSQKSANDIKVIGLTNQRETVSLFQDDQPLHRFIVWQDRRTSDACQKLRKKEKTVQKISGLTIDPYFSSTKINWLIKELKISAKAPGVRFRTIESFLFQKLCGVDVTEATNASRTALLDLKKVKWSETLFDVFDVPRAFAPEVVPSEGYDFKTKNCGVLPDGIPIKAALGDQQAALFGQLGFKKGVGKITYGTGSFLLLNTGPTPVFSKNRLLSTIALQWANNKKLYALEGSAFICGAWIQWLRDQLGMINTSDESEHLAAQVNRSEGVSVIPALTGMGAPFWNSEIRGAIVGLTRGSSKSHIARASLEALCFQNRALVEAMLKDSRSRRAHWKVDGGAVKNNLLLQIQADTLKAKMMRPRNLEATGTGAAWLAAVSAGILSLSDLESLWEKDATFEPVKSEQKYYDGLYDNWMEMIK